MASNCQTKQQAQTQTCGCESASQTSICDGKRVNFLDLIQPKPVKICKYNRSNCPFSDGAIKYPICSWFASPTYFHPCWKCSIPHRGVNYYEGQPCGDVKAKISNSTMHGVQSVSDLRAWGISSGDSRRYFLEKMCLSSRNNELCDEGTDEYTDVGANKTEARYETLLNKKDDEIERLKKQLLELGKKGQGAAAPANQSGGTTEPVKPEVKAVPSKPVAKVAPNNAAKDMTKSMAKIQPKPEAAVKPTVSKAPGILNTVKEPSPKKSDPVPPKSEAPPQLGGNPGVTQSSSTADLNRKVASSTSRAVSTDFTKTASSEAVDDSKSSVKVSEDRSSTDSGVGESLKDESVGGDGEEAEPVDGPPCKPCEPCPEAKPCEPCAEVKPVDPCEKPVDSCKKPVDSCEKPVDSCEKPVVPCEKPVDPCEKPVDPCAAVNPVDPCAGESNALVEPAFYNNMPCPQEGGFGDPRMYPQGANLPCSVLGGEAYAYETTPVSGPQEITVEWPIEPYGSGDRPGGIVHLVGTVVRAGLDHPGELILIIHEEVNNEENYGDEQELEVDLADLYFIELTPD